MTKEQINKAAEDFAEREYEISTVDKDYLHKGFYHGAEWRIDTVWHKPEDVPEAGKDCLVEYVDGNGRAHIRIDKRSEYEWIEACHYDRILRWAYIDDLIPTEDERDS